MSLRVKREVARGEPFVIEIDGEPIRAYPGETVAAILIVNRIALARFCRRNPDCQQNRTRANGCGASDNPWLLLWHGCVLGMCCQN